MENKNVEVVIVCPHCKCQYHPAEIFYPDDYAGKPMNVIRDALGKILYVEYQDGYEPVATEHFVCEECGKPFVVENTVSYKVKKEAEELDFSTDKVSLLD